MTEGGSGPRMTVLCLSHSSASQGWPNGFEHPPNFLARLEQPFLPGPGAATHHPTQTTKADGNNLQLLKPPLLSSEANSHLHISKWLYSTHPHCSGGPLAHLYLWRAQVTHQNLQKAVKTWGPFKAGPHSHSSKGSKSPVCAEL